MPSREQTITDAVRLFEQATYPTGLNAETAWLGIYQTLLWYEPVNWLGFGELPHIIDADKLRPSSPVKRRTWTSASPWQLRAESINQYLANHLGCPADQAPGKVDLLMKGSDYLGMQRQNPLGIAFIGLIQHVLQRFGPTHILYETESQATSVFPGIAFPGRSGTPRIDVLASKGGIPRAILSAKWSVRHDRMSDITNECPVYKAAYQRIFRQARQEPLLYYVLTNEYDPARLTKLLDDSCVDGVVHIHKAAVVEVCQLNGRLGDLLDLSELIQLTSSW
ncbi:MAG: hypothetical protein AB1791_20515 [Chloroflexota bacterium]